MQVDKYLKVIGIDLYNQCTTGEVSKTLNHIACDSDHVPCVLIVENEEDKLITNGNVNSK